MADLSITTPPNKSESSSSSDNAIESPSDSPSDSSVENPAETERKIKKLQHQRKLLEKQIEKNKMSQSKNAEKILLKRPRE